MRSDRNGRMIEQVWTNARTQHGILLTVDKLDSTTRSATFQIRFTGHERAAFLGIYTEHARTNKMGTGVIQVCVSDIGTASSCTERASYNPSAVSYMCTRLCARLRCVLLMCWLNGSSCTQTYCWYVLYYWYISYVCSSRVISCLRSYEAFLQWHLLFVARNMRAKHIMAILLTQQNKESGVYGRRK